MEEKIVYTIPANYTDAGKIFGGLVAVRNLVESIIFCVALGYMELVLIPMTETVRIIVMIVTILPIGLFALIGVDGDSLCQYLWRMLKFLFRRRKIHFKKAVRQDEKQKE